MWSLQPTEKTSLHTAKLHFNYWHSPASLRLAALPCTFAAVATPQAIAFQYLLSNSLQAVGPGEPAKSALNLTYCCLLSHMINCLTLTSDCQLGKHIPPYTWDAAPW